MISIMAGLFALLALVMGLLTTVIRGEIDKWPQALFGLAIVLGLFYVFTSLKQVKGFFSAKSVKYGFNTAVVILIVLAIVISIESFSARNSWRKDYSANKRYSIDTQSQAVLTALKQDVLVTCFYDNSGFRNALEEQMDAYRPFSKKFSYRLFNSQKNPEMAKKYELRSMRAVIVESGEKREKLESIIREQDITNALIKVTREKDHIIYFVKGHGEKDINDADPQSLKNYSLIRKALEDKTYTVKDIFLATADDGVPADCSVLVIAGPEQDFYENEIEHIRDYVNGGGKLFVMLDPSESGHRIISYIAPFGVRLAKDFLVIRPQEKMAFGGVLSPVLTDFSSHPITRDLAAGRYFCILHQARSVSKAEQIPVGITVSELAATTPFPGSWAHTDFSDIKTIPFNGELDTKGPVNVAVAVEIEEGNVEASLARDVVPTREDTETETKKRETSRIVVIGDSDFVISSLYSVSNASLFLNCVSWLAGEEDLIAIQYKPAEDTSLPDVSVTEKNFVAIFCVVVMPLIVVVFGIVVYAVRRRSI
ncbi:GldG family protein [Candidatus Hydrogenedentota bacterium]